MDPPHSSTSSNTCSQGPFTILEFSQLVSTAFAITNDLSFSVPVVSFPTPTTTSPPSSPPNPPPFQPSPSPQHQSFTPTSPTVSPSEDSPTLTQAHTHFISQSLSVPIRPWQRPRPTFHFFASPTKLNSRPKMFDRIKKHASALVGYNASSSTPRSPSSSPTTEHFHPIPTISLLSSGKNTSLYSLTREDVEDDGTDSDFIPYLPLAVQYERAFPYSFSRAPDGSTSSLLLTQRSQSSPTTSLRSLRTRSVGPEPLSGKATARSLGLSRSWSSDSSCVSSLSSSSRDSLDSASTATDLNSPLTPQSPHFFTGGSGGSDSNTPSAHSGSSSAPTPREGSQTRVPAFSDVLASDRDEDQNSEVDSKVNDANVNLDQDPFAKGSVQIVNHYYQQPSTRRHPYASHPTLVSPYNSTSDSKANASSTKHHHRHHHNSHHNHRHNTSPNSRKRAHQPPSPPPKCPLPQVPTSCTHASNSSCSSTESTSCIDGGVAATARVSSSTSKSSTPAEHWTLGLNAGRDLSSLRECEKRLSAGKSSSIPSSHSFPTSPEILSSNAHTSTSPKHLTSPSPHTSMLNPHIPTSPSRSPSKTRKHVRSLSPIVTEPVLPAHEQKPVHRICSSSALLSGSGSGSDGERDLGASTTEERDLSTEPPHAHTSSSHPTEDWTLSLPLIQMRIPEVTLPSHGKLRGRCQSDRSERVKRKYKEKRSSVGVEASSSRKTKDTRARSISPDTRYASPLLSSPLRATSATAPTTPTFASPTRRIATPIRINTDLASTPSKPSPAPAPLQCTPLSRPPRIDTRKVAFADVGPLTASSSGSNERPPSFITASRLFLENYRHYEGPMTKRKRNFLKIRREQERGEGKVGVVESAMEEHGSSSRARARVARLPINVAAAELLGEGLGGGEGGLVRLSRRSGSINETDEEEERVQERELPRKRAPWEVKMKKGAFILQPVPRVFLDDGANASVHEDEGETFAEEKEDVADDTDDVGIRIETVFDSDSDVKREVEEWLLSSPTDEASLISPISTYRMPTDQFPLPPPLTIIPRILGSTTIPIPTSTNSTSTSSDNNTSSNQSQTCLSSDVDRRTSGDAEHGDGVIRTAVSAESLRTRKRMSATLPSYVNIGDLERACAVLASYRRLEGRVSEEEQPEVPVVVREREQEPLRVVEAPMEVPQAQALTEMDGKKEVDSDHDSGCDVASLKSRRTITPSQRLSTPSNVKAPPPRTQRRRMIGAWVDDDDDDLDADEEEEGVQQEMWRDRYSLHTEEESVAFYSARSSLSWALGA